MHVVGYTYDADTWCADCLPVDDESEDVGAIFETDEWDYDVHCNACHELLLEGYIKRCAICHTDVEYARHGVIDEEGDYLHERCWLDTLSCEITPEQLEEAYDNIRRM